MKNGVSILLDEYKCCVCMEIKMPCNKHMYTVCSNGHSVCLNCIFNIVKRNDDEVAVTVSCPLCRQEVESIKSYGNKITRVMNNFEENAKTN